LRCIDFRTGPWEHFKTIRRLKSTGHQGKGLVIPYVRERDERTGGKVSQISENARKRRKEDRRVPRRRIHHEVEMKKPRERYLVRRDRRRCGDR
jgi:nucleoside-triphosphatase THEP1